MARRVPTEGSDTELFDLRRMFERAPATEPVRELTPLEQAKKNLTEEEYKRFEEYMQREAMDPPITPDDGLLDTGLDYATRALDYTSGPIRTAVGTLAGQATAQDWIDTAKGKAPMLGTYKDRAGMGPGPRVSDTGLVEKDSLLDLTTTGTIAGLGDMVLSPSPLLSTGRGLLNALAKRGFVHPKYATLKDSERFMRSTQDLKQLEQQAKGKPAAAAAKHLRLNPSNSADKIEEAQRLARLERLERESQGFLRRGAGSLAETVKNLLMGRTGNAAVGGVGGRVYRYPQLREIDEEMRRLGKQPLSDLLLENGVSGTKKSIAAQAEKLQGKIGKQIGDHESLMTHVEKRHHGPQNRTFEALAEARGHAENLAMSKDPNLKAMGLRMIRELDEIAIESPHLYTKELSTYKREQQGLAGKKGQYKENPPLEFEGENRRLRAKGARRELENTADTVIPGLGGSLHRSNQQYGLLEEGIPMLRDQAGQFGLKDLMPRWSDVPFGVGGYMVRDNLPLAASAIVGGRVVASPWFRTNAGKWMHRAGRYGLVAPALRESLLESQEPHRRPPSPWQLITPGGN